MVAENTQDVDITVDEEIPHTELPKPKSKNPKRIEQGKKLAEWNKKNKKQSTAKVPPQNDSIIPAPVENCVQKNNNINYLFVGGTIIIGGIVIGSLYFTQRGVQLQESKPQTLTPQVSTPQADDFDMA